MSNVTLREYYREVETLVAQGRLDEVVAHCRHILKFFPKDVATYRLLGKSYLESRRLSDATDILQRVLSVVPDDFVSHVGMSLIREDEGNLDAAIWHMERAFEVQPSNSAIRDEVRRLFGRRDGIEPPKIRLTRGALARMYANGNLFQQSIGELRSALSEEPQRFDLLVLLARMYFLNGQHVDAAEVCNNLLNKLPFCLDANRILAAILHTSGRDSEAGVYMERMQVLDPYSPHSPPGSLDSDLASDAAITLPHLEWEPGQEVPSTDSHPSWASSLGIDLEDSMTEEDKLPEWLQEEPSDSAAGFMDDVNINPAAAMAAGFAAEEMFRGDGEGNHQGAPEETYPEGLSVENEAPGNRAEDLIPDWMKDSGWATAESESESPSVDLEDSGFDEPAPVQPMESDDIPDWLRDIAPESVETPADADLAEGEMSGEIPAWLSSQPPGHSDSVVMWLQEHPDADNLPKTGPLPSLDSESGESVPDWLDSVVAGMAASGAAEALDRSDEVATAEGDPHPESH
jgi:tetratricopeptide (TPR) repeat protein